jgi:phage gp45-like
MKVIITSMNGNTFDMNLPAKENVHYFIEMYRKTLKKNQRVKVTCDLLGIDGYIQGTAPLHQ